MDVADLDLKLISEALLASAPERPKNTKKELVRVLLPQIQELQRRGYTYREIVALLQKQDIDLTESTLKTYVQQLTRSDKPTTSSVSPMRLLSRPIDKP